MAKNKQAPAANSPKPKPQVNNAPAAKPATTKTYSEIPSATTSKVPEYWFIAILIAIAFLINTPTINYDYTLDDPFFTKDNPMVKKGVSAIPEFFTHAAYYGVFKNHDASYRPLLLTSFAIEKDIFGFNPKVSHLVNLFIFCLQILALFLLLRRVLSGFSVYVPFFILLLFELHPIHTEVVASVKSRDELLALLFTAICTLQSMKYIDTDKTKYLITSGIFFFLALMSKETPITFVAIVPMTIYFFRDVNLKKILTACAPYLIVSAIYMVMRAMFIESDGEKVVINVNNNALMATTDIGMRLATLLFIQLKYIILLIFPHPLSYDYSYNQIPIISFGNVKALAGLGTIIGLLVIAFKGLKSKSVYSYSILFYLGSVVLTSNLIVIIGATMAERFVYTASLGFCIGIVFLILKLLKVDARTLDYPSGAKVFYLIIPVALLYSVKTFSRNDAWKSNLSLYETDVNNAPESWRANNLLGVAYTRLISEEKDPVKKKELYDKAVARLNKSIEILPGNAEVYLLKGYANDFMGNHDDSAMACYKETIRCEPTNREANNNMGAIYLRHNQFKEAIDLLTKVVAKDTVHTEAIANLAAAYGNSGNFGLAIKYYQMAIRINPDQPGNVWQSMTNLSRITGDSVGAKKYAALLQQWQANQGKK